MDYRALSICDVLRKTMSTFQNLDKFRSRQRQKPKLILLISFVLVVCPNLPHAPGFSAAAQTNQLDIPSLLRDVEAQQKANSAKIGRYSYTLKRTVQELNDKGELKKEKIYLYRVFPRRHSLPVILLLSEDGKPLSDEKLAKEKIKVNKYWQEHKNDGPKTVAGPEANPWFKNLEFSFVGNERYEERDAVVLS